MFNTGIYDKLIEDKLLNLHTAFLGKVQAINDDMARVQPLTKYRMTGGKAASQATVLAVIPSNIKYRVETIRYCTGGDFTTSKDVLVPDSLAVGDLVVCVVCERDITQAKKGISDLPTPRHHDMNDSVIMRVL